MQLTRNFNLTRVKPNQILQYVKGLITNPNADQIDKLKTLV